MAYIPKFLRFGGDKVKSKELCEQLCEQLLIACKNGDIAAVKDLLSERKDFNINWEQASTGFTPLKYAAYYGHQTIVQLLLEHNRIDPNYCGGKYCKLRHFYDFAAPIYLAVTQAHKAPMKYLQIIQLLYIHGADINFETRHHAETPLLACIKIECLPIFKYLISKQRIILKKMNGNDWSPLHVAAFYNTQQTEILEILLKYDASLIMDSTSDGSTALHLCARSWPMMESSEIQRRKMMMLIKYGADINTRDAFKKTALDYLSETNKAFFIDLVMEKRVNDDEKELMMKLYPTPHKNEVQQKLVKENEELKSEMAELQQKFDLLLNKEKDNEETQDKDDDLWQNEVEYIEFVEWLTKKVKLKQYLKNFEEDGWSDVRLIPDLNKDELEMLGITRSGHQRIILKEVEKYKQQMLLKVEDKLNSVEGAPSTDDIQ